MFYVVSYDISDDRRRLNLVKTLLDFGAMVQYSVFECLMDETAPGRSCCKDWQRLLLRMKIR